MKLVAIVGALACGAVVMGSSDAEACSQVLLQPGYVTKIQVSTFDADDPNSPSLCTEPQSACLGSPFHQSAKRFLSVSAVIETAPAGADANTYLGPTNETFVLKDGTGKVVQEQPGFDFAARFDQLGATVCVKTTNGPDAGAAASEVCAPVTVTSLEVPQEDQDKHLATAMQSCLDSHPPGHDDGGPRTSNDAGSSPSSSNAGGSNDTNDGGCNASGASPLSASGGFFALIGLAFAAARRRARVRRDGGSREHGTFGG